jgi:hypothetical protein
MLAPLHPGKVIAVALNTLGLDAKTAQAEIAAASKSTGLPCVDVVRVLPGNGGCEELANAVLAAWEAAGSARRVTAKAARKISKKSRAKKTKANKTVSPATKKAVNPATKPATKPAVRKNVKKVTKR